jgi:hypothetical protein
MKVRNPDKQTSCHFQDSSSSSGGTLLLLLCTIEDTALKVAWNLVEVVHVTLNLNEKMTPKFTGLAV